MPAPPVRIAQIAVAIPLRRSFDYLIDTTILDTRLMPGMRVLVPFGKKREQVGLVTNVTDKSELALNKLKPVHKVIDKQPLFSAAHLKLLQWSSDYYQYPLGEVIFNSLPTLLRQGKATEAKPEFIWHLSEQGKKLTTDSLSRAPNQSRLINLLQEHSEGVSYEQLHALSFNWYAPLKTLEKKGLVSKTARSIGPPNASVRSATQEIKLNPEQKHAVETITSKFASYQCFLLEGVTGSGKTEVYIELARQVIQDKQQALILVPEIGLTPQFIARLNAQLNTDIVVLHSALSENERLKGWLAARDGDASVILGTRSAIWTPLKNPGIFIVDEEHDLSYKQQDGFRYSARDIAIMRSKSAGVPIVLGSATPSMESLHNVNEGKFHSLQLSKRIGDVKPPQIQLIDMRAQAMTGALSKPLIESIKSVLADNKQILLFLNRRGFSPVMMCHSCGWLATCHRCDVPLTFHKHKNRLICHHCSSMSPVNSQCAECHAEQLLFIGHGTERLTETLAELFPEARILRIDRDTTRRKGSMKKLVDQINAKEADILVGTQMLAKGHHFPNLKLVGIIDTDNGLFSTDFRASERMAQLFIQVSGRAGREEESGTVLVQTHFPQHPLLQALLKHGYSDFARALLLDRRNTMLPPFSYMALLRAEANDATHLERFMTDAASLLQKQEHYFETYGPVPAPIAKRSGRLRYQFLIQARQRHRLQPAIKAWCIKLEDLRSAKKVRWSLDIDPQDIL